ncbi:MAG TPA: histidinol-phosphatase [Conexibacter sp.]|jgi:histidinol-phosphatase (PHP family)|nr:histidinol-phosphatase [Conexibacter sp.]
MLTDYHVHLRPDGEGSLAADYFTPGNVARYREAADERGIAELGASEHVYRFREALDVWQHPFWRENAVDDLDAYVEFAHEQGLRVGVEADFVPGREDRMANLLDGRGWDYVIGSVHFVGEQAVDHPDWDIWSTGSVEPEKVWRRYFETLGEAARSGLFDILAHPDLVKVWGADRPRPEGDLRRFYELAIEGIAEGGVAVEVSTAGLRKPVGERYPAPPFLAMCLEAGCPIALSSDAHHPEHVGYEYASTVEWLAEQGVRELSVFDGRTRRLEPLG